MQFFQNCQYAENFHIHPIFKPMQLQVPEKPKKKIFDKENYPRGPQMINQRPFFNPLDMQFEQTILCDICHKNIVFSKYDVHLKSHKIPQSNNNIPINFEPRIERNHSAFNNRVYEEIPAHNLPFEMEAMAHGRGHVMRRVNARIFNDGPGPIRNLEIPQRRPFFRREDGMRRHHEKKKNKKFKEKDIDILFPIVKYEEERGKLLDEEAKKCSICLNIFCDGEDMRYLTCLHRFHKECIDAWLLRNITCPLCKKDLIKLVNLGEKMSH